MALERQAVEGRRARWAMASAVIGFVVGVIVDAPHFLLYPILSGIVAWFVFLVLGAPIAKQRIRSHYLRLFSETDEKILGHQGRIRELQEEVARLWHGRYSRQT